MVSKLVRRGYQSHLADFLLRINLNNFYNAESIPHHWTSTSQTIYSYDLCYQDHSLHEARQGDCLVLILAFFLIVVFLKKRLIEKIIPRKNWICLQSISEPLDLKIFLNKKFNETVVSGLRLVPLHPHDGCKWIHCHDETFEILDIYEASPSHSNGFYILGNSFTFYP